MLKNVVLMILSIVTLAFISACSSTQPTTQMDKNAITGYDVVSYYVSGKSNKGDVAYQYTYKNSDWSFQNLENLEKFKSTPEKFMPLYNGFCAYEISEGKLVQSDPKIWHIYNKKLYLFSDERARQLWFRDITDMIASGKTKWAKLMPPVVPKSVEIVAPVSKAVAVVTKASPVVPTSAIVKPLIPKLSKIAVSTPEVKTIDFDEPVSVAAAQAKVKTIIEMREVALDGYDPVAYFTSGESFMSDGSFHYNYNKTEWFFKSEANLEKFKANPEAYMPFYSGFCAYELAFGNLVESDPRFWRIYNKRLYFFSTEEAKTEWYQDISKMLDNSKKAWERMTPR